MRLNEWFLSLLSQPRDKVPGFVITKEQREWERERESKKPNAINGKSLTSWIRSLILLSRKWNWLMIIKVWMSAFFEKERELNPQNWIRFMKRLSIALTTLSEWNKRLRIPFRQFRIVNENDHKRLCELKIPFHSTFIISEKFNYTIFKLVTIERLRCFSYWMQNWDLFENFLHFIFHLFLLCHFHTGSN